MRRAVPASLALLTLTGCGAGVASARTPTPQRATAAVAAATTTGRATIGTRNTGIGTVLVNGSGRTVYLFAHDRKDDSRCHGGCAGDWPPVMSSGKPKAAGKTAAGKLGTIARGSGRQVTYAGHPLYTYLGDSGAGQTHGQDVDAWGGAWYAVKPSGHRVGSDQRTVAATTGW